MSCVCDILNAVLHFVRNVRHFVRTILGFVCEVLKICVTPCLKRDAMLQHMIKDIFSMLI